MTTHKQDIFYVGAKIIAEQLDDGVRVTATDRDGTSIAFVRDGNDGTDGRDGAKGKDGINGIDGVGVSSIDFSGYVMNVRLSNGIEYHSPSLQGEKGEIGERGAGIKEVRQNSDYTLTLVFEDGHEFTTGVLRGEKGERGDSGLFDPILSENSTNAAQSRAIKAYIDNAISGVAGLSSTIVDSLPSSGKNGVLYLLVDPQSEDNQYDEYLWINSTKKFERIGATSVDLSGYVKESELSSIAYTIKAISENKVDKVSGKDLSSNDFTDAMKNKLNSIATNATSVTADTINDWGFAQRSDITITPEVKYLYRRLSNNTLNI